MLWYSYYANVVILLLDVKFKISVFEFINIYRVDLLQSQFPMFFIVY